MCDIWINVLLYTSALFGPLYIVNWNALWNSETVQYTLLVKHTNYEIEIYALLRRNAAFIISYLLT
jgi:hypothetical protein